MANTPALLEWGPISPGRTQSATAGGNRPCQNVAPPMASQWLEQQEVRPNSQAFARLPDPEPLDEGASGTPRDKVYSVDAALQEQHNTWGHWWRDAALFGYDADLDHQLLAIGASYPAQLFTPEQTWAAARSFATTTSSVDGIHPRQLALLTDEAL
jgi:hypothetical protein